MNTTTTAPRKSDISRALGRILGKDERSAAHGWDVTTDGHHVIITLNYGTREADRDAYEKITATLATRYRLEYTATLSDYDWLPQAYKYCAVIEVRAHEPQHTPTAPTVTPDATAITVDLPAPFCAWFDEQGLTQGRDDRDPECKETRQAYQAGTDHGTHTTVTATPTVLRLLAEYAGYCLDANAHGDEIPEERRAAETLADRISTARRTLKAAQGALSAQQGPQETVETPAAPAAPQETAQGPQETTAAYQGPAPVVAHVEWTKTVRGHHNGSMRFPNGATYKIVHVTRARADRGAKGDHIAYPSTGAQTEQGPAITWGLTDLVTVCAEHAGYTGPVTTEQTGRERLTRP